MVARKTIKAKNLQFLTPIVFIVRPTPQAPQTDFFKFYKWFLNIKKMLLMNDALRLN